MSHSARSRILGSLLVLCLGAATAQAAQTPYVAVVVQPEAEVRCKPSTTPAMYPTNRLRQGTRVLVLEERSDGWLGIQPPESSYSWINATQVQRIAPDQNNWAVNTDGVRVLIGSQLINQAPTVKGVELARGTQVRSIGAAQQDGTALWLPIDPPAGEIRYIRAEAVSNAAPLPASTVQAIPVNRGANQAKPVFAGDSNRTVAVRAPGTSVSLSVSGQPATTSPPPANATPWERISYLEGQERWDEAMRLYLQLAHDLARVNPNWSAFASQRATYIRNGGRVRLNLSSIQPAADRSYSTFQPAAPTVQQSPPPQVRLAPPADPSAPTGQTSQLASWSSPQSNAQGLARSGAGRLVRSGYRTDTSAPIYRLEYLGGRLYASAGQGVDLEAYVDRQVELFGTPPQYRGDLKANYMVVSRVQPL